MNAGPVENIYRLSPMQEGMLFHSLSDRDSGLYVEQVASLLVGGLDPAALRRAWEGVLSRHSVLRASFHWEEVERPVQVVYRQLDLPWREEDWRGLEEAAQDARFEALVEADRRLGFDPDRPPLMRVTLVRLGDRAWRFLWSHHHLLLDGWSLTRVLQEVFAGYQGEGEGSVHLPPVRPYVDYIAWLEKQDLGEAEAFWRRTLDGFAVPTPLPMSDVANPRGTPSYEDRLLNLPAAELAPLEEAARRAGVTLGTLVQGAWGLLLARATGEEDAVFGTVVSGRPPHLPGSDSMVGLFINTLPVRARLGQAAEGEVLQGWLRRLQEQLLEQRRFEYSPLAEVQKWSGVRPGEPLFQTLVAFENYPRNPALMQGLEDLEVREMSMHERTNYPLNLAAVPLEGLQLRLTYDRRHYEPETAERLLGHLRTLLEGMAAGLGRPIEDLPLLDEAERRRILADWNGEAVEVPDVPADVLVDRAAAEHPDTPAVVGAGGAALTYRELIDQAESLAERLRDLGVGPEVPVGLCLERSPELVAAMLAVWKAGGAYVPLDPEYPAERLRYLMEDSQVPVLVTRKELADRLPVPEGCRVEFVGAREGGGSSPRGGGGLVLGGGQEGGVARSEDGGLRSAPLLASPRFQPPPPRGEEPTHPESAATSACMGAGGESTAYLIYTSGSTGRPKGTVIRHRGVVNFIREAARLLELEPGSRLAQTTSPSFDASVLEIFPTLVSGATLHLIPRDTLLSGAGLADELRRLGITTLAVVPSLLATLPEGDFPALRTVLAGAERCPAEIAARWSAGRKFINAYGPTEITVFATTFTGAGEPPQGPPIGRPIANAEVYVVDARGRPVPVGVPGEIRIGGIGLARGYLDRPDLTAERFVPHPFSSSPGERLYRTGDLARWRSDGNLELLGRIDQQVKVRGHRVECGEVEAALVQHPAVREAAVIGRDDLAGGSGLAAYVVANTPSTPKPEAGELRRFLAGSLPAFMVPAAWVFLDALPLSPAGKIDRRALRRIEPARPEGCEGAADAPRSAVEETLARILADVLRVERVGIHDDFFDLGGDSILSIQAVSRAAEAGLQITPRQVFERPTVAALAEVAMATSGEAGSVAVEGPAPLTPIQRSFLEREPADLHHFNMSVLLTPKEPFDPVRLERALSTVLDRHDALRLRFEKIDGAWTQRVAPPEGPVPLTRIDVPEAGFVEAASALQASLDLSRGVVRAALFEQVSPSPGEGVLGGTGRGGRGVRALLLVIHHLAIDAVSWRVLLEDFERAYQDARLPAATTPFSRWAERLEAYAGSSEAARELPFWRAQSELAARLPRLPIDSDDGADTEGTSRSVMISLDPALTRSLLKEAHRAYQTRVDELLLAALVESFSGWTGERALWVDLEGHGREPVFAGAEGIDLSRTVGWFTSVHPVLLDVRGVQAPGEVVKTVKEGLRRVPNRGLAHGVLRVPGPPAEVSFNYLGQVDMLLGGATVFDVDPEPPGAPRSPRAERPYRLEVSAWVRDGRLAVNWLYGERRHRRETVERLADRFLASLQRLIEHCLAPDAGSFTPSDFPAAALDQKSLDRLLGKIGGRRK